jgi:hypothetical protein
MHLRRSLVSIPVIKASVREIVEIAASSYGKGGPFRERGVGVHISWGAVRPPAFLLFVYIVYIMISAYVVKTKDMCLDGPKLAECCGGSVEKR